MGWWFGKLARALLGAIVLPVPTARTKGVLVAPTVYGNVLLGPTAEDVADRSDVATTASGLESLLAAGRRILPSLAGEEVTATYAGLLRAGQCGGERGRGEQAELMSSPPSW